MEDIFQDGKRVVMEHDRIHPFHRRQAERERKKETKKDKCSSARCLLHQVCDLLALAIYSPKLEGEKGGFCPLPFFPRLLCPGLSDVLSILAKASLIDRAK